MHKLLSDGWEYTEETIDDVSNRYHGFGSKIFILMEKELPIYYQNLRLYRSISYQVDDVFCICEGLGHDFGIQLDPDCEVICLWDEIIHIEIGNWSNDEYREAIDFIKDKFKIKHA